MLINQDRVAVRIDERAMGRADKHGFGDHQWLGCQWDNPEITSLEECRYYVAVAAESFKPKGEIGRFQFPSLTVAEIEIRGGLDLELRALQWFYADWLPPSGCLPDDHPGFEAWMGRPFAHGYEHFELKLQMPVRRG